MKMVRLSYRFLPHKVHSHCKLISNLRDDLALNFWFLCCLGDMTLEASVLVLRIIAELVALCPLVVTRQQPQRPVGLFRGKPLCKKIRTIFSDTKCKKR